MQQVDTIIHARWIIPVEPDETVYEYYSLVIQHGKILDILPSKRCLKKYSCHTEHNLDTHALIPGFINTHTHASMALMRGMADDLPLMEWLSEHIWPAEGKFVNYQFVKEGTDLAIAEMLRGGTTTFNDMYFFPDAAAKSADESGIRASIGLIMIDFPSAWAKDSDDYLHKGIQLHDQYRHHPLISTAFAPHAPYTVSDEPLEKIKIYAEKLDIPIHIHLHETQDEIDQSIATNGLRPIARLENLGLLSPLLMAVHMTQLNDDEITLLKRHGVSIVHCPESNLKLASGFCPVGKLTKKLINVTLGTDGAASNNDLDMLSEMRTAALLAKAVAGDASVLPAHSALKTATLNGAKALGLDKITGSLTIGKAADITAINLNNLESQPVYNPVSQIVYSSSRDHVTDVWVQGKHLLNNRQLTTLDREQITQNAIEWGKKIHNESNL
ncbi:MAG: TRZ/ATZ family hydrolase [gamma proteobacterium symbiont of Bathyaustriella thionipta]|nr:TRZ/ATZ family hydrolase [gamma proteobacterium symbiont of Bathyaustriella thionipta]MCU7949547.1 TRZ/ATZ family hydrolase [gamma proteobacterium symbiont of Bathyaustriella thionipta]MCU7952329.1 TRZ/ATZ family hydrolase [gamma proteobacterium symbiont of Bathyaustriella thionipta]MCU7956147.1 TRZ/ATZ family hydrolase [gamma proteobacterium symbiont of Bathyaustriella thionipta]MCU7967156.1 TRZ/ATZ family hydrolase [gamma proteobacterium symbiont of Bathyaustriella thionipta]